MKKVYRNTGRLLAFSFIITGAFSFANIRPIAAAYAYQDSISKKGIQLSGSEEVPPVSQAGSGSLDVSYNKSSKTLTYSATWSGMTDSVTMMHFHGPAEKGANAGVVFPIPNFTKGKAGTAMGTVTLDEVKLKEADLLSGKWCYNIHTKTHPAGEIRGQVVF